jgi:hypothetical protein
LPGGLFVCRSPFFWVALLVATDLDLSQNFTSKELLVDSSVSSVEQLYAVRRDTIGAGGIMFCDGCGAAVQPGQAFCSRCGKQVLGPVAAWEPRAGRVQGHVHLLGILWLSVSAFNTIAGVILYVLANTLFAHLHEMGAPKAPTSFVRPLLSVIALTLWTKAAGGFLAGWGLLHREPWARVVALVLGFIALFHIPFGTAVGVYTLWVLLPAQSQQEYDALAAARAA